MLAIGAVVLLGPPTRSALAGKPQQQSPPQQQGSQSQQSSSAQQSAEAQANSQPGLLEPKKRKVWTNEDLVALRTPADIYLLEKEAQELAAAEAAAKTTDLEKQVKDAGSAIELPSTAEATQQLIANKEAQTNDLQEHLDQLNKDLPNAEEASRAGVQKELDAVTDDLSRLQLELKFLRKHLEDLGKTAPQQPTPQQPPSPSAQSPEQP